MWCVGWCGAGRGQFTAAVEVQEQKRLILSFLHHMAVQRLCKNPLEDEEVVGITNYLDIGLQASAFSYNVSNNICTSSAEQYLHVCELVVNTWCEQVVTNIARKHNQVDTSNIDSMAKDVSNADANLRLGAAWQVLSHHIVFNSIMAHHWYSVIVLPRGYSLFPTGWQP